MSLGSRRPPKEPATILKFDPNVLRDEKLLVSEIERILGLDKQVAIGIIGKTSSTAYRRVHEIIASALDRLIASPKYDPSLLIDLGKALIMVRYQASRDQISDALASYLDSVLRSVIDEVKSNWDNAKRLARNARIIIDALAVLVYEYT